MPHIPASSALSRFRVLDLTRVRAGPTCVKQLADFGADVVKIEMPGGDEGVDDARHSYDMQNLHRNKRSMTLNLKVPSGREAFMAMVAKADVVVENYRPDVKNRLGIDYESLRRVNRRIVLASISGFGQDGPYAGRAGLDQVAQGMSGFMSVTGEPGRGPMRAGTAVADIGSGLYAALGILTALLEREASGEGQWVQSCLLQANIALLDFQAARYLQTGEVPRQVGNDHPVFMPTSAYITSDGYLNLSAPGAMWKRLCDAMGRPDLLERPEFRTGKDRSDNREALKDELNATFSKRSTAEWIEELNAAGVPCGPIYDIAQAFDDPQVRHLEAAAPVEHPKLGTLKIVNQAVKLTRTPAAMVRATPEKGEHTDEVLKEYGFSEAEIASLRSQHAV